MYSNDKNEIIFKLEVGLSNYFINSYKCTALYHFEISNNLFYHHPNVYVQALHNGFPFLKKNYFSEKFRKLHHLILYNEILYYLPDNIKNYLI